jgi:crotonobetainyl-CoA:carnitine CoA-transferase CaiB-like acyl-CoA transferase
MGNPAWSQDERLQTLAGRKAHEDMLDEHLGQWTQNWEAAALMHTLQQAGVPAGMVNTNQGVIEDAQLQHRGHFVYLQHPELGRHPVQRSEFRLSKAPAEHRSPAPLLGQHTEQVCREIFGMSDAEIAALMQEGVLEDSVLPDSAATQEGA